MDRDLSEIVTSTLNRHRDNIMKKLLETNPVMARFSHAGRLNRLAVQHGVDVVHLYDLVGHAYGSNEMEEALQKLEGPHGETLLRAMLIKEKDRRYGKEVAKPSRAGEA